MMVRVTEEVVTHIKDAAVGTGLVTNESKTKYEGRLISNARSEIFRKRDHVFKQTKVGSKVQYFSYKLTYIFFDIVVLSFNTFFPT